MYTSKNATRECALRAAAAAERARAARAAEEGPAARAGRAAGLLDEGAARQGRQRELALDVDAAEGEPRRAPRRGVGLPLPRVHLQRRRGAVGARQGGMGRAEGLGGLRPRSIRAQRDSSTIVSRRLSLRCVLFFQIFFFCCSLIFNFLSKLSHCSCIISHFFTKLCLRFFLLFI